MRPRHPQSPRDPWNSPSLFLKMHLFSRMKKYQHSHKERFQKDPHPQKDAATLKVRCSNFNERKVRHSKCPCMIPKDPCACSNTS